ncbi:aldolase/citrate lyase family protein [Micromonospora sp. CPM1]|uniref:HpcH/HpaI aldolase family protein n=1 Tax=Micromonospora sp. CPM1 TaxID=2944809 RepID=UPI00207C5A7A|nr:aldolase/citrate lyase family protein [Micromonospora sp. CPM1]MCO1616198.1 aldolase/citrate lyase family protein [Micromonospora sp. CPM1]
MSTGATGPRRSRFRAALARPGGPALGTWVKLPVTESVELLALAGFDFVVVDLEHAPIDMQTAYQLIGTANQLGLGSIVRIPALEPGVVQRVLDAGAEGVMVPHVDTVEQARAAVSAVRFPPLGARGVGSTSRAGAWGATARAEYLRYGQEEVVLIAQIESARAASSAGAIAAVPGVDALLVGAADLSTSEGTTEDDPRIVSLVTAAVEDCLAAGVPIGNAGAATAESVRRAVATGYTFTLLGNDAGLLGAAARAAVEAGRSVRRPG